MRMKTPPAAPPTPGQPTDRTKALLLVVVGLLVIAVVVLASVLALRGRDDEGATSAPPPTPSVTSSTAASQSPTSDPADNETPYAGVSDEEARTVVWPKPGGPRYDDPVEAAVSMATELVGFTSPVAGTLHAGDARSGEVPIRAKDSGPVTTVQVRQLSDGFWYVLGAATDDLQLESPAAGAEISSPVSVSGRSRAFEGTILVSVLSQGDANPLGQMSMIGGAGADLGPFRGEISYDAPDGGGPGAVVVTTDSAEDGRIWQATVVPVMLAG
jgi:hypothetical protein